MAEAQGNIGPALAASPGWSPPDLHTLPGRLLDGTLLRQLQGGADTEKLRALEELRRIGWYWGPGSHTEEPMKPIVDTLRGMIRDEHESLRIEAIDVLARLSQPGFGGWHPYQRDTVWAALPELVAIVSDSRQDERLVGHAIDAMQMIDGQRGAPALAGVLFDRAARLQLRLLAARALQWSPAGRAQLGRAAEDQGLPDLVREAALDAVCEQRAPECTAALRGHSDPAVRQ